MRALLTMLGIIIGIASVIGIISVGNSLSLSITSEMKNIGTNNILLRVREKSIDNSSFRGPVGNGRDPMSMLSGKVSAEDKDLMTLDMLSTFTELYKSQVDSIGISESDGSGQVKAGRLYANVSISGVNPGYVRVNNLAMISGRFINDRDMSGRKKVCIVSDRLVKNIFKANINPVGQEVRLYKSGAIQTYSIAGVYKHTDSPMFMSASTTSEKDTQTAFYIPITVEKLDKTIKNFSTVTVMSNTGIDTGKLTKDIERFFEKYYKSNPKWEVSAINMSSQIEIASKMLSTVSTAIAVIAAISLLVGGIGVMNIMLVSVTERTREIGTRKALGAKNFHIRMQFISEAMIISLIGGVIGLFTGLLLGVTGSSLLGTAASFSLPTIFLTIAFSMAIGIFFGYYPANKAAKLDPIDALRYE
jgi:putative ABC transport system permease protein